MCVQLKKKRIKNTQNFHHNWGDRSTCKMILMAIWSEKFDDINVMFICICNIGSI